MNIRRIYAIFLRQLYLLRGNIPRFLQIFTWTTVDIILWGFLTKYLSQSGGSGLRFIPILLGAVLLWNFLGQVMQGISMSFMEDSWSRNFLNFFGSPLEISEYITGFVLAGIARSALALIVMILFTTLAFVFSIFIYGSSLALFLGILFLFGITLGIVAMCLLLRFGPSAEWLVWPIPAFISPFVGVLYPLEILPHWMQTIGHFLPPSYVFEGARSIISGNGFSMPTLLFGMGLSFIYLFFAYQLFKRVYRKALRTGLIARYSAETMT